METHISFHNIEKSAHAGLQQLARALSERHLERHLSRFSAEPVQLHVHLEKSRHRERYQVKLQLGVQGNTVVSREESDNLEKAIRKSFSELERQLERTLSDMRREDSWRRKERREVLRRLKKAIADQPGIGANLFGDLVRPLLPALQRFVKRELSYLRARGDLAPDYPTLHDVIDEVLARAYQKLNQRPDKVAPQQWLHQIVQSVLAEEVSRRQTEEGRFISTESKTKATPDETVDERDESFYEFYQPDEMLRLEDVTPVAEADLQEAASDAETRRFVDDVLAELPTKWRRALLLAEADDLPLSAVAEQLDASEEEVKRWIDLGNTYLRARLEEMGLGPTESGPPSPYFVPVAATSTPELEQVFNEITGGENKPAAGGSDRSAAPASSGAA